MRPHKCYPDYNSYNISPYKLVQLPEPLLQELDALAALQLLKGVPAQESHTSAWLVSPAAGCEKKKNGGFHNRASDHQIE